MVMKDILVWTAVEQTHLPPYSSQEEASEIRKARSKNNLKEPSLLLVLPAWQK